MELLSRLKNFDWMLFFALVITASAGMLSLASTNIDFFWRQLVWYALAFTLILCAGFIDWKWVLSQTWFRFGVYGISVAMLLLSQFQSASIRGTKSWILFAGIQFEPVEIAKLGLIFVLAGFFSRKHISAWQTGNIFLSFVYAALPAVLALLHPDFGSSMVLLLIWAGFLLIEGINRKRFLAGFACAILAFAALWVFVLKDYQKDRLTGFLFPTRDPFGANYNVIQSKIAIGAAGFLGKGFGQGTQSQLHFLPEAQTDFIFAAFVEEWGLLGGTFVILTFFAIVYRLIVIGIRAQDNYSKFIVLGTALVFTIHFFINVGSNMGVMLVTGITLPFFSYGGSSVLTIAVLISIIERIKLESR